MVPKFGDVCDRQNWRLHPTAKGPIKNIPAMVQIMAWRQAIIWTNDGIVYWRMYVSLGLNELKHFKTHATGTLKVKDPPIAT